MELTVRQEGNRTFFDIFGDIDERGAEVLKLRFRQLNLPTIQEVVFDFSKVNHIGSAGIGKLLLIYKDIAINGGNIRIENLTDSLYEMLSVLKLDTIFSISRSIR